MLRNWKVRSTAYQESNGRNSEIRETVSRRHTLVMMEEEAAMLWKFGNMSWEEM